MATATGVGTAQCQALIQSRLIALRAAFDGIQDLYRWTSGLTASDLATAAGISTADAGTYLSAVADAYAESLIHLTGQAPGTYPQVTGPYPFGASQSQVIGPQ